MKIIKLANTTRNFDRDSESVLKAAFDAVEGQGFYDHNKYSKGDQTIDSVIGQLLKLREAKEASSELYEDYDDNYVIDTIYGNGGVHRYPVRLNGNIAFSAMHANYPSEEHIEKARQQGFEIF